MKRYIKASISGSAPDWLKNEFNREYGSIKQKLIDKYHIAIDRANFTRQPTGPDSIPIYLLRTDYGTSIYCPGINDKDTGYIGGRNRTFGAIAKSRLPQLSDDVVYVNISDPANTFEAKERYQDPRYSYRHNQRGTYVGQYMKQNYLGHGEYEDAGWSDSGMTPSNESRARDKSGYRVPSPEEMISRYYSKFPERITDKIDNVYNRLIQVRDLIMSIDLNANRRDDYYGRDTYSDVYRQFGRVVGDYRDLLSYVGKNGELREEDLLYGDGYYLKEFSKKVRNIISELKEIENAIR